MTSIIHHFLPAIHSSGMFCTGWPDLSANRTYQISCYGKHGERLTPSTPIRIAPIFPRVSKREVLGPDNPESVVIRNGPSRLYKAYATRRAIPVPKSHRRYGIVARSCYLDRLAYCDCPETYAPCSYHAV
jgi:hypothetical protein